MAVHSSAFTCPMAAFTCQSAPSQFGVGMLDRGAPAWFIPLDNCFFLPLLLHQREMGFSLLCPHHIKGAAGNTSFQGSEKPLNKLSSLMTPPSLWSLKGRGSFSPLASKGNKRSLAVTRKAGTEQEGPLMSTRRYREGGAKCLSQVLVRRHNR